MPSQDDDENLAPVLALRTCATLATSSLAPVLALAFPWVWGQSAAMQVTLSGIVLALSSIGLCRLVIEAGRFPAGNRPLTAWLAVLCATLATFAWVMSTEKSRDLTPGIVALLPMGLAAALAGILLCVHACSGRIPAPWRPGTSLGAFQRDLLSPPSAPGGPSGAQARVLRWCFVPRLLAFHGTLAADLAAVVVGAHALVSSAT